ncbi:MAG: hypothetical protein ACREV5_11400 [Steroidobacter sp.]
MNQHQPSLEILERSANVGYGKQPLPSQRDHEIRGLVENTPPAAVLDAISADRHAATLRVFAERATALAVRHDDQQLLRIGLTALGLAGLQSRDSVLILALYYDAAKRLQIDVRWLFGAVGNILGEPAATSLTDFLNRSDRDKSLEAMGYKTAGDKAGFCYERTW